MSNDGFSFDEMEELVRDAWKRVRAGDDPDHIWLDTLKAHAITYAQDLAFYRACAAAAAPLSRDAVLEEAARVCDERRQEEANTPSWETAYARGEGARCCAAAIRALKSEGR